MTIINFIEFSAIGFCGETFNRVTLRPSKIAFHYPTSFLISRKLVFNLEKTNRGDTIKRKGEREKGRKRGRGGGQEINEKKIQGKL